MKKLITSAAFLCALALFASFLSVSLHASEEGARAEANVLIDTLAGRFDLMVRPVYWKGFLRTGQSNYITYTLYRGNEYVFAAGGCESARDVDLLLYDENLNLIARDSDSAKRAVVSVTPRWSGTFYMKVNMYEAEEGGAHWVLMCAYR